MRGLRAWQASSEKWFNRVDTGDKSLAVFRQEVARQFTVVEADVVIPDPASWTGVQHETALAELAAGFHDGRGVVNPPPPVAVEAPDDCRRALGSIFAGTAREKRQRWGDVIEKYPVALTLLILLRAPLTADGRETVTEITTRIKAKIGTGAAEVLTQVEYDALKTLAAQKGLGALVP